MNLTYSGFTIFPRLLNVHTWDSSGHMIIKWGFWMFDIPTGD